MAAKYTHDVAGRLARLEGEHSLLKKVVVLTLVTAALVLLAAFTPQERERMSAATNVVEATEFRLVDENGTLLARLGVDEKGWGTFLTFYEPDGPTVTGRKRLLLGLVEGNDPLLALNDKYEDGAFVILVEARETFASARTPDGGLVVLVASEAFSGFGIRDRDENSVWEAGGPVEAVGGRIGDPRFGRPRLERAYVAAMKSDLRNLTLAQESYFSDNLTYTSSINDLHFTASQGVTVRIHDASDGGWTAAASHAVTEITCSIFTGDVSPVPPATVDGAVQCTE